MKYCSFLELSPLHHKCHDRWRVILNSRSCYFLQPPDQGKQILFVIPWSSQSTQSTFHRRHKIKYLIKKWFLFYLELTLTDKHELFFNSEYELGNYRYGSFDKLGRFKISIRKSIKKIDLSKSSLAFWVAKA